MSEMQMDKLVQALLEGDQTLAAQQARDLRAAGLEVRQIIAGGVEEAMAQLDAKCTVEQFNLLEIMISGRAVMRVMKELYPGEAAEKAQKADVVLAALEGDVHDIGKNIVKMVFTATGFVVADCGKDCPLDRLVATVREKQAKVVGISGLITTIVPQVRQVKARLAEQGLGDVRVMAGGAALKQSTAENLGVDFVAKDAFDGLHFLRETTGGGA